MNEKKRFVKRTPRVQTRLFLEALEDRTLLSATLLSHYNGIDFNGTEGYVPPDTNGAAGPNSYVETTNQTVAIYSPKTTGTSQVNSTLSNFFFTQGGLSQVSPTSFLSDPVVTWDEQIQRFIVADQNVDSTNLVSNFDIAVSKSASPATLTAADWNFSSVSTTEAGFDADYPGNLGWNHDSLVFTLNMFNSVPGPDHVQVDSIDINALVNGTPLVSGTNAFAKDFNGFSLRPTVMHDSVAGDPMWFVEEAGNNSDINVVKMTNGLSNAPTFTTTSIGVTPYFQAVPELQPNGLGITTNTDSRIMKAAMANGQIVAAHQVSDGAGDLDEVQWYVFNTSGATPTLQQQGDITGGPGTYYAYPGIDINSSGDIGMSYIASGTAPGQFMSTYITGRTPTEATGTMETPILVQAGQANYADFSPFGREGDLSGINVDSDGSFWVSNEYANSEVGANWGTTIAHFTFASVPPPPTTGTISGRVFNDVPHAGLELATDPGLKSWTVYLDASNAGHYVTGDRTAITAADGSYTFTNVAAGTIKVGEILQPNYVESVPTSGGEQSVTVTANATTSGVDFGDYQLVKNTLVDDGALLGGFQLHGSGWKYQTVGVNSESRYHAGTSDPSNSTYAQWTTALNANGAGAYELYASWVAKPTNASNAVYQIFDAKTGSLLGSVTEDQTQAPTQASSGGAFYQKLGTFSSSNGSFIIKLLTNGANGNVVADAVMEAVPALTAKQQHILFYAGDVDASNPDASSLVNERNTMVTASTYQNFVVPVGQTWTLNGLYSNNVLRPGTTITGADWSISSGVSTGNGGTVVASGSNASATITATGRTAFGLSEDSVAVSGLNVVLGPGTYWVNVTPVSNATGQSFNSNTFGREQIGSDIANQQFLNSSTFGVNFANANTVDTFPNFSDGVIGSVSPSSSPPPFPFVAAANVSPSVGNSVAGPSALPGTVGSPSASPSTATFDNYFILLGAASVKGASPGLLSGNGPASATFDPFNALLTPASLREQTANVDELFATLAQKKRGNGA